MNSFLTGLGGVAVGALLATAFRTDSHAPTTRTAPVRTDNLDRAIARLESVLSRFAHSPRGAVPAEEPNTDRPQNEAPPGRAPERDVGQGTTSPPRLLSDPERVLSRTTRSDALAREVPTSVIEASRKFMLWSVDRVLDEFGRPTATRIDGGHPAFEYTYRDTAGNRRNIRFVFIEGIVFRATKW